MSHRAPRLALIAALAFPLVVVVPDRVPSASRADGSISPDVLDNESSAPRTVEVTITAAPARLSLVVGGPTDVFAYNGRLPGPTLEVKEGDRVIVHFRNRLDEPSTIHWHGMRLPFTADGSPYHPIAPGTTFDYAFTVPMGSAGTYWYHPHPDHRTGHQVARGLYGALIVRAADDPLPRSLVEQVVVLSDNRFQPDGSLDLPARHSLAGRFDEENGREGNVVFVSGKVMPTITVRSGEIQRWRVINASAGRIYRLAIPGHTLLHVGSDGGLFEHPIEVNELLVAPAERVEVLVRATGAPGSVTTLRALPYDRYIPQTRPLEWKESRDLLTLRYTSERAVTPPRIPATLRYVPPLDPAHATATRVMSLSQGMINGKRMDMNRIDVSTQLGATEIWEVENLVGMDHPFHLHGFEFQVLDRNGIPEKYRSWKDVVNVPRHETARFIVKYTDFAGKWMFHCHILDHEDHGMMGVLEITERRSP